MSNGLFSLVTFRIGTELYGVDIMEVVEIIRLSEVTPIPNAPDFVDGVITLRGEIIPIVDLGKRFLFGKKKFTEDEELLRGIVIVTVENMTIGIVIDQVNRVVEIFSDSVQPPPQMTSGIGAEYIDGVSKIDEQLLIVLNVRKLFDKRELLQLSGKA